MALAAHEAKNRSTARSIAGCLFSAILATAFAAPAGAGDIGGGGPRAKDCVTAFRTLAAPVAGGSSLRCRDGDPSCDEDGIVNGECSLSVGVCANRTSDPVCTSPGVDSIMVAHATDNGDPLFDPAFQALQTRIDGLDLPSFSPDDCTTPTRFVVKLQGPFAGNRCRGARKVVRLESRSVPMLGSEQLFDRDTLRIACLPAAESCDPTVLFSGTFDRIQTQIFDRSCALSGCHDSQTQMSGLLLEVGASLGNLVGVDPQNGAAVALGWKRVTAGDPAASLLMHKVSGELGAGLGERMPFQRKPLPSQLVEILRLGIEAGAPATGWVAGTDH